LIMGSADYDAIMIDEADERTGRIQAKEAYEMAKVVTLDRRSFLAGLAIATLASALVFAQAPGKDALPDGQMKIVVPYSPGGGTDILARAIAQQLGENLHRTVIVENRVGANGVIGAAYVAKAPPDGLTMLLVPAGYAANPAMYKSLPYDQSKDLMPLSLLASGPLVLVVHPSLDVKSVQALITRAKAEPGRINVGNAGSVANEVVNADSADNVAARLATAGNSGN